MTLLDTATAMQYLCMKNFNVWHPDCVQWVKPQATALASHMEAVVPVHTVQLLTQFPANAAEKTVEDGSDTGASTVYMGRPR